MRTLPLMLAGLLLLCALPIAGAAQLWSTRYWWLPWAVYASASAISALQYRDDKSRAASGRRRRSERSLHVVELLGGWPGAWCAQRALRHKTRKVSYRIVFWLIVALHQSLWALWLWLGADGGSWLQRAVVSLP